MSFSYDKIIEPLWGKSEDGTRLDLLDAVQCTLIQIQLFEDEINGGGLPSVFYNNGGDYALASLDALTQIGATVTRQLLADGIALFPNGEIPKDIEGCREMMELFPESTNEKWGELSDIFYANEENLMDLKRDFIQNNAAHFTRIEAEEKGLNYRKGDGSFNYFVCDLAYNEDLVVDDGALDAYAGVSFNLGMKLELPTVRLKLNTDKLRDVIPNSNRIMVVNAKFREILSKHQVDYLQYSDIELKLKSGELIQNEFKALNLLNCVDAIDKTKSEIEWSEIDEDEDEEDRYPRRIRKLVLDLGGIKKDSIFRLNQFESQLIMRGDLVEEFIKNEMTGVTFYAVSALTY